MQFALWDADGDVQDDLKSLKADLLGSASLVSGLQRFDAEVQFWTLLLADNVLSLFHRWLFFLLGLFICICSIVKCILLTWIHENFQKYLFSVF